MKPIIERMKWKNENCVYCIVSSIPCWLRTLSGRNERAQRKKRAATLQQRMQKACSHGEREKRVNISSGGEWSTYGAVQKRKKRDGKSCLTLSSKRDPTQVELSSARTTTKMGNDERAQRRENSQHSQIILFENQLNCNLLCCVCVVGSYQQHLTLTLSHLTPILIFSPEHCNVLEVLQYSLNDDNRFY